MQLVIHHCSDAQLHDTISETFLPTVIGESILDHNKKGMCGQDHHFCHLRYEVVLNVGWTLHRERCKLHEGYADGEKA